MADVVHEVVVDDPKNDAGHAVVLLEGMDVEFGKRIGEIEEALRGQIDRLESELRAAKAETDRIKAETEALLKSPILAALEDARSRLNSLR